MTHARTTTLLLAALGGLCTTAAVPPFGWWPLAVLGLALLAIALCGRVAANGDAADGVAVHGVAAHGISARRRFAVGFVFGIALYGPSLWWMTQFSLPGGLFVAWLESMFTGFGMVLVVRRQPLLTMPAAIVIADSLRSLWPFGGLPLGGIDLGVADSPFAASVPFGGRLLLIGLVACTGSVVAATILRREKFAGVLATVVLTFLVVCTIAPDGTHRIGSVRVALVQGGGPLGERASEAAAKATFEAHVAATRLVPRDVDLILWPENTVDVGVIEDSVRYQRVAALARAVGAPIVIGVVADGPPGRFLNQAVVINADGSIGERFDKVRRVPYGEYFPFRSQIEGWGLADLPPRDALPGSKAGWIETGAGRFAIAISYEGFFDDRTRGGARSGGEAILLPTNASSYLTTQVPTQQMAAAMLRARETGRWVAQAAPTGRSGFVDHRGSVVGRSMLKRREVLTAVVERRSGQTPYARWNDTLALMLCALVFAAGWATRVADVRRSRNPAAHRVNPRRTA